MWNGEVIFHICFVLLKMVALIIFLIILVLIFASAIILFSYPTNVSSQQVLYNLEDFNYTPVPFQTLSPPFPENIL